MQKPTLRYNAFQTQKGNIIWNCSLPLAWKQLAEESKFKIEIPQNQLHLTYLLKDFSHSWCQFKDADQSSIFSKTFIRKQNHDFNPKYLEKVPKNRKELIEKLKVGQLTVCGILHKKVKLKYPFYREPESIKYMFFEHKRVGCFEPMTGQQKKQVNVLNYTDENNFLVKLKTIDEDEDIFFLKTKDKVQLNEAIEIIVNSSKNEGEMLADKDVFKIPHLSILTSRNLPELQGIKLIFDREERKFEIADFFQSFAFEFESIPPKIELEEEIFLSVSEYKQPKLKARNMCLNKAFWVMVKRKNRRPYIAMYITKIKENR